MKIEDYEKYYQKGGSYVIPTEVFNELFNELEAWKEQAKKIEKIRLDQTKKVFDTIAKVIKNGSCSYRHLIYDELGFGGKYYEELLSGMTITNAICDLEELREQHEEDLGEMEKLTSVWKTKAEEKRELEKKYVNAVADYETTMFEKEQLNSLVNSCQEEIRQLKKQLENKYEKVGTLTGKLLYEENTKLINQQKTFIKYLEDEIESSTFLKFLFEMILQKYKSIIGVSNENNT